MSDPRSEFLVPFEAAKRELAWRRSLAKIARMLTFGLFRSDRYLAPAIAAHEEALRELEHYDALASEAEMLTASCAESAPTSSTRLSQVGASMVRALGTEDYGPQWPSISRAIRERDDYRCQEADGRCNGPLQVHHVTRLSRGGTHASENLVSLCHFHHSLKHPHMRGR